MRASAREIGSRPVTFLGYEDEVGEASIGEHLHWHVAVIPPDTVPTYNGYYLDYVDETGQQPEVIPIVCHQGGRTVLWRTRHVHGRWLPCGSARPARSFCMVRPEPRSPVADGPAAYRDHQLTRGSGLHSGIRN